MIKIICDDEEELEKVDNMEAVRFTGKMEFQGNKRLVESQMASVLLQLMKCAPELLENSLTRAEEMLKDGKSL